MYLPSKITNILSKIYHLFINFTSLSYFLYIIFEQGYIVDKIS